jgi:hypothetical protein
MSGAWTSDDTFELCIRWVETCNERKYDFRFIGDELIITPKTPFGAGPFGGIKNENVRAYKAKD